MKATPLLIAWHNDNAPIYSVHFDPHGKGRLATAGKYVSAQDPISRDSVLTPPLPAAVITTSEYETPVSNVLRPAFLMPANSSGESKPPARNERSPTSAP